MRIAMIISTPFPPEEGIGNYVYNLSKKMIEHGYDISVITRGGFDTKEFYLDGIKVYKTRFIPVYPFHVDLQSLFLKKILNTEKFDLLHIHSPLSPPVNNGYPLISTIHTSLIEDIKHYQVTNPKTVSIKLTTYISGQRLIQKLINNSDVVTTVSPAVSKELKQNYKIYNPVVMGNGVDETKFYPVKTKDGDYVLYVGRLDYRKGILDLIEAFKQLKNVKLYIAGDGPLKGLIEEKIAKNRMENIFLLGHISGADLVKIYQNALIFVFPSYYEGLPTSLLEAMSCALPIVTTNIPAHKDLIENNDNGLLVKPNAPLEIVEGINRFLLDENLQRELGQNARQTVENNFTWDKIASRYEVLYQNMVK